MAVAASQGTPALIRGLLKPSAYPHPVAEVHLVQTHISYLLLAGDYAYKVKKSVALGFLDYSTLERRAHFCRREVELNRRLCPSLYLGVAPIVRAPRGPRVGGEGDVVEWCVVMRRLPEERMLSRLLTAGEVTPGQIRAIARTLARFHAAAATGGEVDTYGQPVRIRRNTDENFRQLRPFVGRTLTPDQFARIRDYADRFLDRNGPLFGRRIRDHRVRDCHGDVHAASVCLTDEVVIFDCIEFNDRFRYGDVASEVAFLAMDLAHYGRGDLAWELVDAYRAASGDDLPPPLLDFYACYRAVVRAKVESFKLDEVELTAEERREAAGAARSYGDLADSYAGSIRRPMLVITCGLMGTGKTTLARDLAARLGFVYRSSDVTRKRLVGLRPTDHRYEAFGQGIYADDVSRRTYDALLCEAEAWLGRGCSVVLDASFKRAAERSHAQALANRLAIPLVVVECVCPDAIVHQRVEARAESPDEASDARWALFAEQKRDFEPCQEIPPDEHIVVRTDRPRDDVTSEVLARLRALAPSVETSHLR